MALWSRCRFIAGGRVRGVAVKPSRPWRRDPVAVSVDRLPRGDVVRFVIRSIEAASCRVSTGPASRRPSSCRIAETWRFVSSLDRLTRTISGRWRIVVVDRFTGRVGNRSCKVRGNRKRLVGKNVCHLVAFDRFEKLGNLGRSFNRHGINVV